MHQANNARFDWQGLAETLEEDNRQLRAAIGAAPSVDFIRHCAAILGISASRAKVLSLLMEGKVKSRHGLWIAYSDPAKERPDIYIIDTLVSYLRRALRPYGVHIENVWGEGWVMSDDSKARVREILGVEAIVQ